MDCSKFEASQVVFLLVCLGSESMLRVCNAGLDLSPVMGPEPGSIAESINRTLVVPLGNKVQQLVLAVGTQTYNHTGSSWFVANATAVLYNFKGEMIGHHFFLQEVDSDGGQPTWVTHSPFSLVTGKSVARLPQPDAIDWVLLKATSANGNGRLLGSTRFIQRLYTQRGLPPPDGFIAKLGDVFESPYVAVYCFWNGLANV